MTAPPVVAVTGASGFVGGALAAALVAEGREVVAVGRGSPVSVRGVRAVVVRAFTAEALAAALPEGAPVVHCASIVHRRGLPDAAYRAFNVDGTAALLEAARRRGAPHVVLLGSIKVHGEHAARIDEETPLAPEGGYAASKAEAEAFVTAADRAGAPPGLVLRLCPVHGRGDQGNVRAMIRALAGHRFFVPGDGATRKSLVHVSTVVAAVRAALDRRARGVLVLADSHAPSIRELADAIARALGRRPPPALPAGLVLGAAGLIERVSRLVRVAVPVTRDLVEKALLPSVCDPRRAELALGIRCHVDLAAALEDEIAWLREARLLR